MLAQAILAPFGVADAAARKLLLETLLTGGYPTQNMAIVTTVQRAYDRLPVAARGPATTAAFAWAKAYVNSPAFASEYEAVRNERKPRVAATAAPSVDEEVKKFVDDAMAAAEESRKMALKLPEADRARLLAQIKAQEEQLKSPEHLNRMRTVLAAGRSDTGDAASKAVSEWEARYPADLKVFVRGCLERFMTATATVDYSLPTVILKGARGETVGFLSPGYTGLPWESVHAILAGREAVTAARTAVEAWLKELR